MKSMSKLKTIFLAPDRFFAWGTIQVIGIYQKTFSPDHSDLGKAQPFCGCKFYPSCSEYAVLVLEKQGFVMGMPRVIWRVLRCNPLSKGGVDKAR